MKLPSSIKSLLSLLLLIPALAFAGEPGDMDMERKDHREHMERMADKLGLDDSQRQQWKALHENYHPRMKEIHKAMKEQRQALREASEEGFNEVNAEAAAERLGELTSEASLMRARMHAQVREMLTEQQRDKFKKYYGKDKKHKEHGQHHNKDHDMKRHQGDENQGKKGEKQHH